jgi:hypothetical protein
MAKTPNKATNKPTRSGQLGTRLLTSYSELESYLKQFADGIYRFLWVMGRPGVGKTETAAAAVQDRRVLYVKSARVSALALYQKLHEHLNEPVVLDLDEMSDILRDPDWRRLFLALGENTESKTLYWHTTTPLLGDVPREFETGSTLCVVSNEEPRQAAVRSRATILEFAPTNREVHAAAARWFWHQEIYDWVGRHLDRLHPLDMRWYSEAYSDLVAGRDWQDLLMKNYALNPAEALVQDLESDPARPTRQDKERRFAEVMAGQKGGSRANYHLILRRLRKAGRLEVDEVGTTSSIQVRGKRPPSLAGLAGEPGQDFHRLGHELHHEVQRLERVLADQEETIELRRREAAAAKAEAADLKLEVEALRAQVTGLQARVAGPEVARERPPVEILESFAGARARPATEEELQLLAGESWCFFDFTEYITDSTPDPLGEMLEDFRRSGYSLSTTLARFSAGRLWNGEPAIAVFLPRDSVPREVMHAGLRKYLGYETPGPGDFIFPLGIKPGDDDALQRRGGRFLK